MTVPEGATEILAHGDLPSVRDFLEENSGLPGPRSNLALLALAAEQLDSTVARQLRTEQSEYLRCCGVARLARDFLEAESASGRMRAQIELTHFAADASWRVRESVAMAGQWIGDVEPAALPEMLRAWWQNPNPLVVRAAVATICEPRLLRTPPMARLAVHCCREATDALLGMDPARRKLPDARTLRQALGYAWSVALVADPCSLDDFLAMGGDPDLDWIVRENRRKARFKKLVAR